MFMIRHRLLSKYSFRQKHKVSDRHLASWVRLTFLKQFFFSNLFFAIAFTRFIFSVPEYDYWVIVSAIKCNCRSYLNRSRFYGQYWCTSGLRGLLLTLHAFQRITFIRPTSFFPFIFHVLTSYTTECTY